MSHRTANLFDAAEPKARPTTPRQQLRQFFEEQTPPMSAKAIRALFTPGQIVSVTNHYITRTDHPCHGTNRRTIARVTSSHLHFDTNGSVEWPKAAQLRAAAGSVQFFGGGAGQAPADLFLTIAFITADKSLPTDT
jgi:hypothetical protein